MIYKPASRIPVAKIAPNLAITSSCLSLMTLYIVHGIFLPKKTEFNLK